MPWNEALVYLSMRAGMNTSRQYWRRNWPRWHRERARRWLKPGPGKDYKHVLKLRRPKSWYAHTHTHTSLLSIPESSSFLQRQVPSQSPSEGQRVHFWGKIPVTLNIDNINRYIYMETKVKRMTFALASSNKDRRHQKSAAQLSAAVWHLVCVSLIIVPNLQQIHRKWR